MAANPSPINYIFVDFENVPQIEVSLLGRKAMAFTLFLGPKCKMDGAVVEKLMLHADSVQLVRLGTAGNNALDFVLSYYVGRAAASDPGGVFHIVSKDTGFDPLVAHLKSRNLQARRHNDFAPFAPAKAPTLHAKTLEHLKKNAAARPKTRTTLEHQVKALSGNKATDAAVAAVITKLTKANQITITPTGAVTYHLPID